MSEMIGKQSFGWLPDYPDFRDYTTEHSAVNHLLSRIGVDKSLKVSLPASADLWAWCPPVEDQGPLGSCTANAGVGMIGYFERRAFGKYIEGSRLFLYKVTRNLLHSTGDRGVFLRSTMGALVLFEVPPEEYWPHITADYHKEPTPFCQAYAQKYQAINYCRMDPPGTTPDNLLTRIEANLSA